MAKIEDHARYILEAIRQARDPTLAKFQTMLATRGVGVSIATLQRFFDRHGIKRKKPITRTSRIDRVS